MEITGKLDELGDARCNARESGGPEEKEGRQRRIWGKVWECLARASTCNIQITELRIWRAVFMKFDIFMIGA